MADLKISQLNEVTALELEQTDFLPIVNNSLTKKVSVQSLMAGSGNGLPAGAEFFVIDAGSTAPDDEYYYNIVTGQPGQSVPIMQGQLLSGELSNLNMLVKSRSRIEHSTEIPVPGWKQVSVNTLQINDSVFLNTVTELVAVSESGEFLKSIDGGQTLETKHTAGNPLKKLLSLGFAENISGGSKSAFIKSGEIYATGGRNLYKSEDSGETWLTYNDAGVLLTDPDETFTDIRISEDITAGRAGTNNLYLLGNKGSIVLINITVIPFDYTLLPVALTAGYDYKAFAITPDESVSGNLDFFHIIANSYDGNNYVYTAHILKGTVTAGINEINTINHSQFYAVWFNDINTGFIAGSQNMNDTPYGGILATNDACNSWYAIDFSSWTPRPGTLKDIIVSGDYVWAAGHNSTILKAPLNDLLAVEMLDDFIEDIDDNRKLLSICVFNDIANVTGDESGGGYYYYYIPDTYDGVVYQFIPVDTLWIKIPQLDGSFKKGFVGALNVN